MNLICTRKKDAFKNLTVNKAYSEATEDGEVYVVTNDAGFKARYAKQYFRVTPEEPRTRNLLDLLRVEINDYTISITLNRTTRNVDLDIDSSTISCGIDQIEGISTLKRAVNEIYAAKVADIIGSKAEMFRVILNTIFTELRENDNRMCWLLSDQIRVADTELDSVLTEMSDIHTTGHNPNSNNEITLWVIK
jgi:hypothetical protein